MTITIYSVGGVERDRILGIKNGDLDFAVEANSYGEMRDYIYTYAENVWLETPNFFTIRAKMPDIGNADFVLCRKEGAYRDGRHPDIVEVGTIFDDLARRDFTMNAIARNIETGEIIDPYDGQRDIKCEVIRCVGGPERSFNDDGLRMFRAFRFAVTKHFNLEYDIQDALKDWAFIDLIQKQEENRVREEMTKMFAADTLRSLKYINKYTRFWYTVFEVFPNLWLKPTVEGK
jgi:tRNA nucleotidyltransferase/poly(A) polymerase